jgi:hypothetical protein
MAAVIATSGVSRTFWPNLRPRAGNRHEIKARRRNNSSSGARWELDSQGVNDGFARIPHTINDTAAPIEASQSRESGTVTSAITFIKFSLGDLLAALPDGFINLCSCHSVRVKDAWRDYNV